MIWALHQMPSCVPTSPRGNSVCESSSDGARGQLKELRGNGRLEGSLDVVLNVLWGGGRRIAREHLAVLTHEELGL